MAVYKVMLDCWQLEPENRPSFLTIHEQLSLCYETQVANAKETQELTDMDIDGDLYTVCVGGLNPYYFKLKIN